VPPPADYASYSAEISETAPTFFAGSGPSVNDVNEKGTAKPGGYFDHHRDIAADPISR
jgi:hypothetical protein